MEASYPASEKAADAGGDSNPSRSSSLRFLAAAMWRYRLSGLLVMALGLVVSLTQVAHLSLIKPMIDVLSGADAPTMVGGIRRWLSPEQAQALEDFIRVRLLEDKMRGLYALAACWSCFAVPHCIFNALHHYRARLLGYTFQLDLIERLYGHLLIMRVDDLQRRKQGDLLGRFSNDIRLMQEAFSDLFQVLLKEPFAVVITLAACLMINWKVTVFALVVLPLIASAIVTQSRRIRRYSLREVQVLGGLMHMIGETIHGITVVKIFQSEKLLLGKVASGCRDCLLFLRKVVMIEGTTSAFVEFLGSASIIMVILWQAPDVMDRRTTLGDIVSVIALLYSIFKPVKALSQSVLKLARSLAGADRYLEIINLPAETGGGKLRFPSPLGSIEFRDLTFGYGDGSEALSGVSAVIREGQTAAIVGQTGAGKTTLLHLLPLFHRCKEGMILLDGRPLQDYDLAGLRGNMAIVSQNVFLFNDSISRNIAMDARTGQGEIEAAARASHAHEFIERLPRGYDTMVGDRGVLLSGGQRQRIALARAMLKNPRILLLDEATSALDSETERLVQQAIAAISRGRTTIVVAHRLSTVKNADVIFVLSRGRLVETGRHEELLGMGGVYSKLYKGLGDE